MKNEIENAQNGATIWQQQQQQNEKHSMTNELIPKMALNATCLNTSKVQENRLPKWIARNDGAKTTHQTKQTTTWRIQLLCKYLCNVRFRCCCSLAFKLNTNLQRCWVVTFCLPHSKRYANESQSSVYGCQVVTSLPIDNLSELSEWSMYADACKCWGNS